MTAHVALFRLVFALAALLALTNASTLGFPAGEHVVELDAKKMDSDVIGRPQDGFYLVEFYSPICGHCRQFAPIYEAVGDSLRGVIPVGRLSVMDYRELAQKYEVKGVPHVALFLPGEDAPVVYIDERNEKDIVTWVLNVRADYKKHRTIVDQNNSEAFINENKHVYPSRFLSVARGKAPTRFVALAEKFSENFVFGSLDLSSLSDADAFQKKYGITKLPAILVHKQHSGPDKKANEKIAIEVVTSDAWLQEIQEKYFEGVEVDRETAELIEADKVDLISYSAAVYFAIVAVVLCVGGFWVYNNRNKKVREIVSVDLNSVAWDVGKRSID